MPSSKATQSFVPVQEIRNGIVILKDGGYRGILMSSSVNFALKSEDEQKAIIQGFQTFLNELDFTVEIVVHSRKMDIRPYLALLQQRLDLQSTELMRLQLREYMAFIQNFVEGSSIMTKMFYVIVPFTAGGVKGVEAAAKGFAGLGRKTTIENPQGDTFEEYRVQLEQRLALVAAGLNASGLRGVQLGTEEIIELLYRSFNLGDMENPIHMAADVSVPSSQTA